MDWYIPLLLFFAGFAAGIVNTLAGSGTVFTLAALLLLGIPSNIANCTNRVGVLFQNLVGMATFIKYDQFSLKGSKKRFLFATLFGALVGAILAVEVSSGLLDKIIGVVMVFLLFVVLTDPKRRLLAKGINLSSGNLFRDSIIFFLIGLYGGFIQVGIGIFVLVALSIFSEMDLIKANAFKLFIILLYTIPTLAYMIYQGKVIWIPAILLTVGQVVGAYCAGRFASKNKNAEKWVKYLLIIMIIATIIKTIFF